jgi:hypothetical protein
MLIKNTVSLTKCLKNITEQQADPRPEGKAKEQAG